VSGKPKANKYVKPIAHKHEWPHAQDGQTTFRSGQKPDKGKSKGKSKGEGREKSAKGFREGKSAGKKAPEGKGKGKGEEKPRDPWHVGVGK
jgi:hypothetical protein